MATSNTQKTVFDFMQAASTDLSAGIHFDSQEAFIAWATENFEEIATKALIHFSLVTFQVGMSVGRARLRAPRFNKPCPSKLNELVSQLSPSALHHQL